MRPEDQKLSQCLYWMKLLDVVPLGKEKHSIYVDSKHIINELRKVKTKHIQSAAFKKKNINNTICHDLCDSFGELVSLKLRANNGETVDPRSWNVVLAFKKGGDDAIKFPLLDHTAVEKRLESGTKVANCWYLVHSKSKNVIHSYFAYDEKVWKNGKTYNPTSFWDDSITFDSKDQSFRFDLSRLITGLRYQMLVGRNSFSITNPIMVDGIKNELNNSKM